ncbi:MAG: molecular chaperone DnaK, partial [Alphaproteobacteria bacterium]|nr:molecular chaperone DnaK [Alphaproteobacteria bacterium]
EADISKMVKDAEVHAAEDKKKRELVEARNRADSVLHDTEKNLKEHGEKLTPGEKAGVEADLAALKEAMTADDADAIQAKTQALLQSAMKLGEAMYKAGQAEAAGAAPGSEGGPGSGTGGQKPDDKVVDATYEEVNDKDKDKKKSA